MSARASFGALVGLSLALLGLASALLGYLGIPAAHRTGAALARCMHLLEGLAGQTAHAATLSERALALLLASMALAGLGAALRSAWLTRATVRRLSARTLPLTPPLARQAESLGLAGRLVLCDAAELYSYCTGLRRPVVHLSRGMVETLDEDALYAVLAHEAHHLRQHDPLRSALATVLAAAAYPFPIAAALRRAHLQARELEADRAATTVAGRQALARALLAVLRHPSTPRLSPAAAIGAFEPQACRVAQLTRPEAATNPRPSRRSLASSALSLALLAGLAGLAIRHPAHASPSTAAASLPTDGGVECSMDPAECLALGQCATLDPEMLEALEDCEAPNPAQAHPAGAHDHEAHGH